MVLLLITVLLGELWLSQISDAMANHYDHAVLVPTTVEQSTRDTKEFKIAVISVIDKPDQLEDYRLAHDSVKCYCRHHQYPFYLLDWKATKRSPRRAFKKT